MEWQGTAETYHERIELGIESFVELSYGREIGATMQLAEQNETYMYIMSTVLCHLEPVKQDCVLIHQSLRMIQLV